MKKLILNSSFLLGLLVVCFTVKAQLPKVIPADLLDKNAALYCSFYMNETPDQKKEMISQMTTFLLSEGFNLVKVEEIKPSQNPDEKARYANENISLNISYEVFIMTYPARSLIALSTVSPRTTKQYPGKPFSKCIELFKADLAAFKEKNPTANQGPYDASVLKREESVSADSTDGNDTPNFDFSDKSIFVRELPKDLSSSTLLILLFDEQEVNPKDTSALSKEELAKRRERTLRFKNKNAKYKERFKEYTYPILFVYPNDVDSLSKIYPYLLVNRFTRGQKTIDRTGGGINDPDYAMNHHTKNVVYMNYCIRDNKKPEIFYQLPKWVDCDKGELFCLKRFINGVMNGKDE